MCRHLRAEPPAQGASGPVSPRKIPLWGAGVRTLWEFRPAGRAGHPGQVGPGPPGFGKRRGPGAGAAPALGSGRGGALCRGGRGPGPGPGVRGHPALRQRGRGHPAPVAAGPDAAFPGVSQGPPAGGRHSSFCPAAPAGRGPSGGRGDRRPAGEAQLHSGGGISQGHPVPGHRGLSSPPAKPGNCSARERI